MQGIKLTALHLSALEIGAYNPIARELAVIMRSQDERIRYYLVFLGGCLLLGEQQGWRRMIPMGFLQQRSGIGLSFVEPWVCPCCRQPLAAELLGDRRMAAGYPEHLEKQSCTGGFSSPRHFWHTAKLFLSRASFKFVLFWYKNNLSISSCLLQTETRRCGVPICGGRSNCISSILGFNVMPKFNQIEWSPDPCFLELSSLLQYTWCIFCHHDRAWRGIFLEIYLTKESQQLCARSVRFQFSTQGLPSAASGGSTKVSPFLVDIGALGDAGMTIFLTPIHVRPTNKGY